MKGNFKNIIIIILLIILISGSIFSQQNTSPTPLELPNFIINGIERLNVRSGIKQFPDKPTPLTKRELDSINSIESNSHNFYLWKLYLNR